MALASSTPASSQLNCPQCRAVLTPQDTVCPQCGANIPLVTLLAEQQWLGRARSGASAAGTGPLRPMSVEQLVPRLGDLLLAQGYITEPQLQEALVRKTQGGGNQLLGQTLMEMGAITRETLDRVIARQILELQNALLQANRTLELNVLERTAELETALHKLTELHQLKSNIVSNISHELRTPLTQMKGYLVLLADGTLGPITSEQREALIVTARATDRLEKLIEDLIAYAAAARGEMTLNMRSVLLRPLVEMAVQRMQAAAAQKGVRLEARFQTQHEAVTCDEDKLFWVLLQLLDNAVKFTPARGSITLILTSDGRRVRFAVQDTGIGIPANRLEEVFEEFQQLDGSTTRRFGGTGLGLALVRRIIEAHGARMTVESQEGRGSQFTFALPAATTPLATPVAS